MSESIFGPGGVFGDAHRDCDRRARENVATIHALRAEVADCNARMRLARQILTAAPTQVLTNGDAARARRVLDRRTR